MLSQLSIPNKGRSRAGDESRMAFDHERLFAAGLQHVERLARHLWTDYNVHDPGITTLELLCYAITDLSYRASFPVEDLLASPEDNRERMGEQFFTARQILPNRPLTAADYRKLMIDVVGVQNAWIVPAQSTYYADTIQGELMETGTPGDRGIRSVPLAGLYDVLVEFTGGIDSDAERDAVLADVWQQLHAHRNLCEDFIGVAGVQTQEFILCCELEVAPDADVEGVTAEVLFQVGEYLAPPVRQYTLTQMLARTAPDGTLYTPDRIFDGPLLEHGFIADEELEASELRSEIRLSDIISIIMDVPGVKVLRDIIVGPADSPEALKNKWVIPVSPGRQPRLNRDRWRFVAYKRALPFVPDRDEVLERWDVLAASTAEVVTAEDLEIPLGTYRNPGEYYSFQNHFPAVYGISDVGTSGAADPRRKALALQLKGYLLFFDQIMAGYIAQLKNVAALFSTDPTLERTYFYQVVDSFSRYEDIYGVPPEDVVEMIEDEVENPDVLVERRNRFLDHLISRFAERFHDFAEIMRSEFGSDAASMIPYKTEFLRNYPAISSGRSIAYDYTAAIDLWGSENVSGLERRLAALFGIQDFSRHDLDDVDYGKEGMYLIENILLRPERDGDPFLPICPDPGCIGCADIDPYSYRIHLVLPAYGGRFADPEFRRWAEGVIREETPAHIQPKVCWISREDMEQLQDLYYDWLRLKAGIEPDGKGKKIKGADATAADAAAADATAAAATVADERRIPESRIEPAPDPTPRANDPSSSLDPTGEIDDPGFRNEGMRRGEILRAFIDALFAGKNVYPAGNLLECDDPETDAKFILGRSALGTLK